MIKEDIRKEFSIEAKEKNLLWFSNNHPISELFIYAEWLENKIIELDKQIIKEI